jgi:ACS family hexuronate transporter-like MFS transporter
VNLAPPQKIPARAWGIVVLVSLALLLFILDRQVLAVLKTTLKGRMGWTDQDYSWLVTGFSIAYTIGALAAGRLIDRAGTRLTATLSIGVMSLAAILCGTARSLNEMLVARVLLGFADAGVNVAAVVAVARWFPAERRATAISFKTPFGLMGFVIAPPLVALITKHYDWHYAFFIPGAFGLLVPLVWWWLDQNPPDYGVASEPSRAVPWRELFSHRALWGILLARVVAEPVYVFYTNWQPGYLQEGLGLTLADVGRYAWIPPIASSVLAVLGGLTSDHLFKGGLSASRSRTAVMQALALLGVSLWLLPFSKNWALAIGVFACIHMVYAQWNNLGAALIADSLPRGFTGTAFGVLNFLIGVVGAVVNLAIGALIHAFGYGAIFAVLGLLYPLAALVLWWFYVRRPAAPAFSPT